MSDRLHQLDKDHLHHAYLIEGEIKDILPEVAVFLESLGINKEGNPDVYEEVFENFSIEDSRRIKARQSEAALGTKKFFILGANFFLHEAQQALLKVLEEPAPHTHFFLITPKPDLIIDTLRSRLYEISERGELSAEDLAAADNFLKASLAERLAQIEEILKSEDQAALLKMKGLKLLNSLEKILCGKWDRTNRGAEEVFCLEEIGKCRNYLSHRGSSIKMLLEHIALILPRA
jgi:hypothetical protein